MIDSGNSGTGPHANFRWLTELTCAGTNQSLQHRRAESGDAMGFGTNLIVAPTCFALGIIFCNWYTPTTTGENRLTAICRAADYDVL